MQLTREERDGVIVIGLDAPIEIDIGSSGAFKQGLLERIGEGAVRVVFDGSKVEFFDSSGMGALLSVHKRIRERGGEIALAGLNRSVSEVFHMVGFDVLFMIHPDVSAAIEALGRSAT